MRITSWNFLHGQRLVPAQTPTITEVIDLFESDLLALQEIDMNLERSGTKNQPEELAAALGSAEWGFAPTVQGTPGVSWKKIAAENKKVFTSADQPLENHYGIAIASKLAVRTWLRHELGKAWIGLPLLIANEKGKVIPFYVKDEPRVALAAVLENGWTIINVHLSFVPFVNIYQLFKVTRWAKKLEKEFDTKTILVGDLNLPWGIPARITSWHRATNSLSYPSWKPAISFDYILMRGSEISFADEVKMPEVPFSDHRPLSVEIAPVVY